MSGNPRPTSNPLLRVYGLTGGVASGKSTVARIFEKEGFFVLDADSITREISAPGGLAHSAILKRFGTDDRAGLRKVIFSDPKARKDLEAILHPLITARALAQAEAATSGLVVFDVPLLVESSRWRPRLARVLVVDCSAETQIARVLQRPGWTRERIDGALAAQTTRRARRAAADAVLLNDGLSLVALRNEVLSLAARWGCETIARP